jgi:hypothetical protein
VRLNPDVPAELERIINKALEKDREPRYQHASEIRADLQRLKRDTESGKSAVVVNEALPPARHLWRWIAAAAVAVVAVTLVARYLIGHRIASCRNCRKQAISVRTNVVSEIAILRQLRQVRLNIR